MRRRFVAIFGAVALAAVGTLVLVAYVGSAEDRALAGERTVDVLVVGEAVERGTPASDLEGKVTVERVPAKVRSADAITSLAALEDMVAAVDLVPGEQVIAGRFVEPDDLQAVGQAGVPDGMQQVTISLGADRAVGGKISPGSTVAVTASFTMVPVGENATGEDIETTHMILHKVLVTNVQVTEQTTTADEEQQVPVSNLLVTLALSAPDVEKVVFAAEHGSIWLSAEPEDAPEGGTQVQHGGVIYQ
ncbi:MAG TPA: Flp pilus assembly protein CpaB [Acidimicrobiia bacterium]|nr:Flp pilus assembly protein CpaB [Acidimicrobiia bacterium]